MSNLIYVLNFCYKLFQYRLSFPPFSFTIWQALVGLVILGIVISVIVDFFKN